MGMFMASLAFRCPDQEKWAQVKPRLQKVCVNFPGLVNNLDSDGPGYVLLSPYGDLGGVLGELVEQVSALTGDYAVMAMCVDSDMDTLELYRCGELVERSVIGEFYYEVPEEMKPTEPSLENWKPLLLDGSSEDALSEALFEDEVFAEDNLRKLSQLTGLPIFDDKLMFGNG